MSDILTISPGTSSRRRWIALVVVCLAMLMNALDSSIVNVALPSIQRSLHFSQANLTWVVDAYLIAFGSFLLLAGRLGDLFGRKKVFLSGVAVFTLSSLVCSMASSQGMLIVARFFQGLGGAISTSVIVAIIVTEFPGAAERAKAMSVFMFVAVGGGSIGLLVGGILTQAVNWHWIFVINVPIGALTLLLGSILIKENPGIGAKEGLDIAGSLMMTLALVLGIYTIVKASSYGWLSGHTLITGALSVGLLGIFATYESRIGKTELLVDVLGVLLWRVVPRKGSRLRTTSHRTRVPSDDPRHGHDVTWSYESIALALWSNASPDPRHDFGDRGPLGSRAHGCSLELRDWGLAGIFVARLRHEHLCGSTAHDCDGGRPQG